jgi:hypothetical protein
MRTILRATALLALAFASVPAVFAQSARVPVLLSADVGCTFTIDGEEVAIVAANTSKRVHVAPGEHLVAAVTADGRRQTRTFNARADQIVAMFEFGDVPVATSVSPALAPAPPVAPPSPAPPPPANPAPTRLSVGAKLFIDSSDEFGMALSAAILKKKVPVISTTDRAKADFFVSTTSNSTKEGSGTRVAKILMFGAFAGSGNRFDATVTVTNRDGAVVFAHNSKKENFQSAAENIAKMLKKSAEGQ